MYNRRKRLYYLDGPGGGQRTPVQESNGRTQTPSTIENGHLQASASTHTQGDTRNKEATESSTRRVSQEKQIWPNITSVVPARWHASQQFFRVVSSYFGRRYVIIQVMIYLFTMLIVHLGSTNWYQPILALWRALCIMGRLIVFLAPLPEFLTFKQDPDEQPPDDFKGVYVDFKNTASNGTAQSERDTASGLVEGHSSPAFEFFSLYVLVGIFVALRAVGRLRVYSIVNENCYGPFVSFLRVVTSPRKMSIVFLEALFGLFLVSRSYSMSPAQSVRLFWECAPTNVSWESLSHADSWYEANASSKESDGSIEDLNFFSYGFSIAQSYLYAAVAKSLKFIAGGTMQNLSLEYSAKRQIICINERVVLVYSFSVVVSAVLSIAFFCSYREYLLTWRDQLFNYIFPDSRIQSKMHAAVEEQASQEDVELHHLYEEKEDERINTKQLAPVPTPTPGIPYVCAPCLGWSQDNTFWTNITPISVSMMERSLSFVSVISVGAFSCPLLANLLVALLDVAIPSVYQFARIYLPPHSFLQWMYLSLLYWHDFAFVAIYIGILYTSAEVCSHVFLPRPFYAVNLILGKDPFLKLTGLNLSGKVKSGGSNSVGVGPGTESTYSETEEHSLENPFASFFNPSTIDDRFLNKDSSLRDRLQQTYMHCLYGLDFLGLKYGQLDVYSLRFPGITASPEGTLSQFMIHWPTNGRGIALFAPGISDGAELLAGPLSTGGGSSSGSSTVSGVIDGSRTPQSNFGCRRNIERIYSNVAKSWCMGEYGTISEMHGTKGATTALNMLKLWQSRMADAEVAFYSSLAEPIPASSDDTSGSLVLSRLFLTLWDSFSDTSMSTPHHLWRDLGRTAAVRDASYGFVYFAKDRREIWEDPTGNRWRAMIWSLTGIIDATSINLANAGYTHGLPPAAKVMRSEQIRGVSSFVPIKARRIVADLQAYDPVSDSARRLSGGYASAETRAYNKESQEREESVIEEDSRVARWLNACGCLRRKPPKVSERQQERFFAKFLRICGCNTLLRWFQGAGLLLPETSSSVEASFTFRCLQRCGCIRLREKRSSHLNIFSQSTSSSSGTPSISMAERQRLHRKSTPASQYQQFRGALRYEQRGHLVHPANEAISSLINPSRTGLIPWILRNSLRSVSQKADMLLWDSHNVKNSCVCITSLLMSSLTEDSHGLARPSIGMSLCSLLTLHDSLIVFANGSIEDVNAEIASGIFDGRCEAYSHIVEADRWLFVHDELVSCLQEVRACLIVLLSEYYVHLKEESSRILDQQELGDMQAAANKVVKVLFERYIGGRRSNEAMMSSRVQADIHPIRTSSVVPLPIHHEDSLQRIWEDIYEGNPWGAFLSLMKHESRDLKPPSADTVLSESSVPTTSADEEGLLKQLSIDLPFPALVRSISSCETYARLVFGGERVNNAIYKLWDWKRRYKRAKRLSGL